MRFINREEELKEFKEIQKLSKKKLFVVALYGLRRVGKTRLLLEFLKSKGLYFFVNKNKTSFDLLREFEKILKSAGFLDKLQVLNSWDDFFDLIFSKRIFPIVFDEFQNFNFVEPSVFGIIQKNIDLNENKPGLIFLSGSLVGLMKKFFQDYKEPLYGRIKRPRKLQPLNLINCFEFAKELKISKEDLLKLYFVFGGYPKYFVLIEDFNLRKMSAEQIIDFLLLQKNAPLEEEVNVILFQEFGARTGVYYTILEAIALGNNSLSSIAGYLNMPVTSITRQIKELKDYFELIEIEKPFSGKKGIYKISNPLMFFWFSQISKNISNYKSRNPEFISKIKKNLNSFFGKSFEYVCKEFLLSNKEFELVQRQWGKISNKEKEKNTYEIDLIGVKNNFHYAFECKWKELSLKQAENILGELKNKTNFVQGLENPKLGLFAKKIKGKQKLKKQNFIVFDLDDF